MACAGTSAHGQDLKVPLLQSTNVACAAPRRYTLYKNPVEIDTLAVVQYLASCGVLLCPTCCIERNHPKWAHRLPSIKCDDDGKQYVGLDECLEFFALYGTNDESPWVLLQKARKFKEDNPKFRINPELVCLLGTRNQLYGVDQDLCHNFDGCLKNYVFIVVWYVP